MTEKKYNEDNSCTLPQGLRLVGRKSRNIHSYTLNPIILNAGWSGEK